MDYAYADFVDQPDPSHRPMYLRAALRSLQGLPRGSAVLDAGCGGGDFSEGLAEAGYRMFGLDLSPSGISAATTRNIGTFKLSSIYEPWAPPFGRDSFDAIICIEVLEHLYSPKTFAARAMEALKPGGIAIISTPYWGYLKNVVLAVTNRMDRVLTPLWEGGHIKHFSRATLTRLMSDVGFAVEGFQGCGHGWRAVAPGLWNGMLMTFRKLKER
jgi:2-polyprenyl-3-methyl-5-hydroxy-6-metoxy-1,4-benzoquinol methylase